MRRESTIHGTGFGIRPALLEFCLGLAFAGLYVWEMNGGLVPKGIVPLPDMIVAQFFCHVILITLMTVATFIDFDEKTIPDEITVPGTILFLILAAVLPTAALPVNAMDTILLSTPNPWSKDLDGARGLAIGLACLWGWCFALVPKTWTLRRGWGRAFRYAWASIFRSDLWWILLLIGTIGSGGILWVWSWGNQWWQSLLSALVGMAVGGGLVWIVRIIAGGVLAKEAMGFGDVTLMSMIGAYVGWQASLLVFFLAPFAALFVALAQWIITRRRDIAFGPYLCLAAVLVIVFWSDIWQTAGPTFRLGKLIPAVLFVSFVLMAGLLMLIRLIEEAYFRWRGEI